MDRRTHVKFIMICLSIETPPPAYSETGSPSPPDPSMIEHMPGVYVWQVIHVGVCRLSRRGVRYDH